MMQSNGAAPPPQQQYQHPLPQQQQQQQHWMNMQQQQYQQQQQQPMQQPSVWPQQLQQSQAPPPMPHQQYGIPPPATSAAQGSPNEVRSLWIGDLQPYMDENYLHNCFLHTGELAAVKVIKNKQTQVPEGYGFIEFRSRSAAEQILQSYNGTLMPNSDQNFRLNWASMGAGERSTDDGPAFTIFVGDLAAEVTDYHLQETFKNVYTSVKGAKVVTDRTTGRSKGYGFVRFGDESEQLRAMTEMNGVLCTTRPMRIGPAADKKQPTAGFNQKASYQNPQGGDQGESDPTNTTIFVGGLDPNVSDDHLKQHFSQFGELIHVKIPVGKRCGFVQFANRRDAEAALLALNNTTIGAQNVRLSWGRSPSNNKQPEQAQWNQGYQAYPQSYEAYGYAPQPQDPNMYYGGYPGYTGYQQPQQ